jgi:tRNA dimethylallyltransferase
MALALGEELGLEIVAADAMQVYRGMDIGTAKPTAEDRARVPHHLIDVVTPAEAFSVADYVRLAEAAIADVLARGRLPLVQGGTGFYIRALAGGLPTAPPVDPEAQAPLWKAVEEGGLDRMVAELERLSPTDAARAQRNPRRVIRALEVLRRTGRPPSAFPRTTPAYRYDKVALLPTMDTLRPRIRRRTEAMFAAGLVDEVRALMAAYPQQGTALQAIGYKEVATHLAGRSTLEEARLAVTIATLQYARRQRTWFRKEPEARRIPLPAEQAEGELRLWLRRRREAAAGG